jgi:putative peptidoglycan lipid II flippase
VAQAAPVPEDGRARRVGTTVARAAGIIAVATLFARAAGFARTLVFSESVGASEVGSVYQSINVLPNVVFEIAAGGVLAAAAVPLIATAIGAGRREDADRIASALLGWTLAVLLPLSALLALAAPFLSQLLLEHAAPGSVDLGARMLVVFAPQVVLYGIGIVLTGVLHAHRRFLAAALAPLLSSLVVIAAYLAYGTLTEGQDSIAEVSGAAFAVLAGGTTLGVVVLSLPLLVPAWRTGARLRPTLRFPDGAARRAGGLAGAGVLALVAQQGAVLATVWLANSRGGTGTVNAFAYVQAVYLLPYAVLAVPIATSAFPALAHREGSGNTDTGTLTRAAQGILVLSAGAAAVLIATSRSVGTFFHNLDRGADAGQGAAALQAIPSALVSYAPGLVGFALAALLTRALYLRGRASLAAAAVAAGWSVAALWPLLTLPEDVGPTGTLRSLGFASSVGMTLAAVLLVVLVRRSWGPQALAGSRRTLAAAVVAAALAGGVGDAMAYAWGATTLLGSVAEALATAAVVTLLYLGVVALADRSAMQAAVERGRRRRGRA